MGQEDMYTVPAACIVDIEERWGVDVTVLDEELKREGTVSDLAGVPLGPIDDETVGRPVAIAEDPGIAWPRWSFGSSRRYVGFTHARPTVESEFPDVAFEGPTPPRTAETMCFYQWLDERGCGE